MNSEGSERTENPRRARGLLRGPATRMIVAAALTVAGIPSWRLLSTPEVAGGMEFLGRLALPADWQGDQPTILGVEPGRRIVSLYESVETETHHLLEYDLSSRLPRISRNVDLGPGFIKPFPTPYTNLLDTKRNRLLMLMTEVVGSHIDLVDLESGRSLGSWDLAERLPGFIGWGFTYSAADDLIYIVGEVVVAGSPLVQHGPLFPKPPVPGVLLALKPDSGQLVWSVALPHCAVLNTSAIGALVARSKLHDAIYVPCARSSPNPNLAGVQRVWINPRATTTEAAAFRQEFFPISGVWVSTQGLLQGVAAFEPETDRIVMQSLSVSTPGAWIFDGRISGWVGFVAAPRSYDAIGVNIGNGHYYSGAAGSPLIVSPIRGTPVPQGTTFEHVKPGSVGTFIHTDAASGRLFVLETLDSGPEKGKQKYGVYLDTTADEFELPPPDYDLLTEDIPEGPGTEATYVGSIRGFGSRVSMIGGTGAVWERVRQVVPFIQFGNYPFTGISPGDRSLTFAHVSSIDLRNPGSAASAQAVTPDTNTDEDQRTRQLQIAELCQTIENGLLEQGQAAQAETVRQACELRPLGTPTPGQSPAPPSSPSLRAECEAVKTALRAQGASPLAELFETTCQTAGVNAALGTVAESAHWPWAALACLDGGGTRVEQRQSGPGGQGNAEIVCNLDGAVATARALAPGVSLSVGGTNISIASSTITSESRREPGSGMVVSVSTEARGIDVTVPGSGSLSIGVARSTAMAKAQGRTGTADAALTRRLERVVVRDSAGRTLHSVNECDLESERCRAALAAAQTVLAPRVRLYEPAFSLRETARGAFAGVEKAEAEYLNALNTQNDNSRVVPAIELILYDDTAEKSRLVVQLAGVQVGSIYYVTQVDEGLGGDPTTIIETVEVPVEVPGPPGPAQVVTRVVQRPGAPTALENTFAVLARSPKEALHLAAIWLLFGSAVFSLARRRTLRRTIR